MNFSCLVWQQLEMDSSGLAESKYQNISFSFFFLYPIGPAKTRQTTSKGADPSVLSVTNFPTGEFEKAVACNFLHPISIL